VRWSDHTSVLPSVSHPSSRLAERGIASLRPVIEELRRVDFRSAQGVLVGSVPGKHSGSALSQYGHMRLRAVLEREPLPPELQPAPGKQVGVISQFSSLGSHARDGHWARNEFETSLKSARGCGGAALVEQRSREV
jgi:hypothetical protein